MKAFCLAILLLAGCGPMLLLPGDTDTDPMADTGSDTEAPPPPSTSTGTSTSTSTTSMSTSIGPSVTTGEETFSDPDGTTGVIFLLRPDGGSSCSCGCDLFAQDCIDGEKCMPWANDGGTKWNATRCSDVADDPMGLGEPCMVDGSATSGLDDCDQGLMCWDVDPDTLQGTCVAMCTGDEANPECPAGTDCLIANDAELILCLAPCDPLTVEPCPVGDVCIPAQAGFVCAPMGDASPPGGSCSQGDLPYECEPGSVCVTPVNAGPPCDPTWPGCCTPSCDLSQAEPAAPCLDPGQTCVAWWQDPPAGFEDVGICTLP